MRMSDVEARRQVVSKGETYVIGSPALDDLNDLVGLRYTAGDLRGGSGVWAGLLTFDVGQRRDALSWSLRAHRRGQTQANFAAYDQALTIVGAMADVIELAIVAGNDLHRGRAREVVDAMPEREFFHAWTLAVEAANEATARAVALQEAKDQALQLIAAAIHGL